MACGAQGPRLVPRGPPVAGSPWVSGPDARAGRSPHSRGGGSHMADDGEDALIAPALLDLSVDDEGSARQAEAPLGSFTWGQGIRAITQHRMPPLPPHH